jgi:hypothetical protein
MRLNFGAITEQSCLGGKSDFISLVAVEESGQRQHSQMQMSSAAEGILDHAPSEQSTPSTTLGDN